MTLVASEQQHNHVVESMDIPVASSHSHSAFEFAVLIAQLVASWLSRAVHLSLSVVFAKHCTPAQQSLVSLFYPERAGHELFVAVSEEAHSHVECREHRLSKRDT